VPLKKTTVLMNVVMTRFLVPKMHVHVFKTKLKENEVILRVQDKNINVTFQLYGNHMKYF
jgi:hypothetical protein